MAHAVITNAELRTSTIPALLTRRANDDGILGLRALPSAFFEF
jgi:hypothetical protein